MANLNASELFLILVVAVSAATLIVWVFSRPVTKPESNLRQKLREAESQASLLFDGEDMLDASRAAKRLFQDNNEEFPSDWIRLRAALRTRFPDFPESPEEVQQADAYSLTALEPSDDGQINLEWVDGLVRVSILNASDRIRVSAVDQHRLRLLEAELRTLRRAVTGAPSPVWQVDSEGAVSWANEAYRKLAWEIMGQREADSGILPDLFHLPAFKHSQETMRTSLSAPNSDQAHWFDVCSIRFGDRRMNYATDVNAVVNAEIAQRNFVQTLAKTFAQLSIGLAIFDRNRQLALFNPALIDLTNLPADFLSSRPNLLSFFDNLRDNQMMPEPKNYRSWREQIADLVAAASDGRYLETWTLPSGLTYRVSGRPHPDGAVAFLFEDISAEVSLTRRIRSDIELNQAVLNQLDDAVAVFSSSGVLMFSNSTYSHLWNLDPESCFAEMTLQDAMRHWQSATDQTQVWNELLQFANQYGNRSEWSATVTLSGGEPLACRFIPITGGATMIFFRKSTHRPMPQLAAAKA